MGFQLKSLPSLILPDRRSTPLESDSESIISTIPTKKQTKWSKNASVRPVNDNNGFHLVLSNNIQPKITSGTTAPPHPLRYPHIQYDYSSKVSKTKEKLIQTVLNSTVTKITKKQPKQPNDAPGIEIEIELPIPHGMFDTEPTPASVLETLNANATSDSPVKVKPTTKSTPTLVSNTYACITNDNDDNNNDDEVVPIPHGMFDTEPIPKTVLETLNANATSDSPIKVKPTTNRPQLLFSTHMRVSPMTMMIMMMQMSIVL